MPFRPAAVVLIATTLSASLGMPVEATTFSPPMLDISVLCNRTFHSAAAMSECVVAESEARAELLSHWSKYSDANAEKCIKLGRKAKSQPYTAMAKCLEPETTAAGPAGAEAAKR